MEGTPGLVVSGGVWTSGTVSFKEASYLQWSPFFLFACTFLSVYRFVSPAQGACWHLLSTAVEPSWPPTLLLRSAIGLSARCCLGRLLPFSKMAPRCSGHSLHARERHFAATVAPNLKTQEILCFLLRVLTKQAGFRRTFHCFAENNSASPGKLNHLIRLYADFKKKKKVMDLKKKKKNFSYYSSVLLSLFTMETTARADHHQQTR